MVSFLEPTHIVIMLSRLPQRAFTPLVAEKWLHCLFASSSDELAAIVRDCAASIQGVVVEGEEKVPDILLTLPNLRAIFSLSSGTDHSATKTLRAGVDFVTSDGILSHVVADHAIGLVMGLLERVGPLQVEAGQWRRPTARHRSFSSLTFGILGLGRVGSLIAKRVAGFDAKIYYHNRSPRPLGSYIPCASVKDLAEAVDVLIVSCSGGAATNHLVNAEVLSALGRRGYLVNVSRGSVVNTSALKHALSERKIAGAALDVLENEPFVEPDVLQLPNLLLTPHIAWMDTESVTKLVEKTLENLHCYFRPTEDSHNG